MTASTALRYHAAMLSTCFEQRQDGNSSFVTSRRRHSVRRPGLLCTLSLDLTAKTRDVEQAAQGVLGVLLGNDSVFVQQGDTGDGKRCTLTRVDDGGEEQKRHL